MAELLEAIDRRRAYRGLSDRDIDGAAVERIMRAATYAPSCFNKQSWRFLVARSGEARAKVVEALSGANYWAKHAPMFVLVVTKPEFDCNLEDRRQYALFDVGMASMNLQLQAVEEGLIAHPMAGFDDVALKRAFGIPEDYILITVITVGHPGDPDGLNEKHLAAERSERTRKPEHEVISYDEWKFD
jgi:nitroreductase